MSRLPYYLVALVILAVVVALSGIFASDPSILGTYNHNLVDASITIEGVDGDDVIFWIRVDGSEQILCRTKVNILKPILDQDYTKVVEPDRKIR